MGCQVIGMSPLLEELLRTCEVWHIIRKDSAKEDLLGCQKKKERERNRLGGCPCSPSLLPHITTIQIHPVLFLSFPLQSYLWRGLGLFSAASSLSPALSFYKIGRVDPCGVPGHRHEPPSWGIAGRISGSQEQGFLRTCGVWNIIRKDSAMEDLLGCQRRKKGKERG